MPGDRWDVVTWKKLPSGKNFRRVIGSALPKKEGGGFTLFLDALPLPGPDGSCQLSVEKPQERTASTGGGGGGWQQPRRPTVPGAEDDDEIPF